MESQFDLDRFVSAQEAAFARALAELRGGRKRTHWMWFVFPQLAGLGNSPMARRYALGSVREAQAYLAHPLLGQRLAEAVAAAMASGETDARRLFGSPDDMKFSSCLTLFAHAAPEGARFCADALDRFYGGAADERTLEILKALCRREA